VKKLQRVLVVFILIAVVMMSLVIGAPTHAADELSGKLTVSVEAWMVDKYNMKELEQRFETDHPQVDVEVITHEGLGGAYQNIFLEWTQTQASTADLYFGGLVSYIAPAVMDDLLLPWDDVMTGPLAADKWIPAFAQTAKVKGKFPTLPGLGETMDFQYNTKLFEQAKVKIPTSYDELKTAACTLAKLTVDGKPVIGFEGEYNLNFAPDTWMAAVAAAEGTYFTKDGKPNWDSQAGKDWIAFQKSIVDDKCGGTSVFTDNNGARNALKAGQAAIINASNSRLSEGSVALCPEKDTAPCKSGEIIQGFGYPGGKGVVAFTHQVYVPRVAKNPKLAQAFAVEQILSEYAQTWSANHFGKMPTLWDNYKALPKNVNFELVQKELEGPTVGQWQYRDSLVLRQTYVDTLQKYISGDISLDDMIKALKDATDKADLTAPDLG
jgi:ABC-type glycerol-3-phosphate transport system substrate-binding protein